MKWLRLYKAPKKRSHREVFRGRKSSNATLIDGARNSRPSLLWVPFTEKRGWVRFLERLHEELGVSTSTLRVTKIAKAFRKQLEAAGLNVVSLKTVIHPKHFAAEEKAMFRFPHPKRQPTKTARWLEKTGGVGGAFGLEVESMSWARVRVLAEEAIGA